jgi:hypothetical protein
MTDYKPKYMTEEMVKELEWLFEHGFAKTLEAFANDAADVAIEGYKAGYKHGLADGEKTGKAINDYHGVVVPFKK